jgi:hypothetical protein
MKHLSVVGVLVILILAGCSSVSIIPKPATAGAVINPSDQSIKINNSGLIVSARVQDTAVGGYEVDTAIGSFYLTIFNNSAHSVSVSLDNFTLVNSRGEKHEPLPPEEVNALLNPEIGYLMPYPYVGYYDVIDLEQYRASTAMASERPYVGEGLPAVDELIPLETGSLGPGKTVSGMLYFNIEIIDESRVELMAEIPGGVKRENRSYSFPFSIEK